MRFSPIRYMELFKEEMVVVLFEATAETGVPASCPLCVSVCDVVAREERLRASPGFVMEGEGKKNSLATRQLVLLPVFVCAYYGLPACSWGWVGSRRIRKALGTKRRSQLTLCRINVRVCFQSLMRDVKLHQCKLCTLFRMDCDDLFINTLTNI